MRYLTSESMKLEIHWLKADIKDLRAKLADSQSREKDLIAEVQSLKKKENTTPQFLVIYHFWFVDSLGFQYELIERENYKMAKEYADAQAHRRAEQHKHCDSFVYEF